MFDFHKTGFYFESLVEDLQSAGFCKISRRSSFDLFDDTSSKMFVDRAISANFDAREMNLDEKSIIYGINLIRKYIYTKCYKFT